MSATIEEPPRSAPTKAHHAPAPKPKTKAPRPGLGRWAIFAACGVAAAVFGGRMAYHAYLFQETDDAYVTGHIHQISPQVDGTVAEVLVNDNQRVKAGDVLARLDPLQYQIAEQKAQDGVLQAKAEEAHADAALAQAEAAITQAQARTAQAVAQQRQAEASLDLARQNNDRDLKVFADNRGAIAKSDIDATQSILETRAADLDAAKANVEAARTGEVSAKSERDSAAAQQKAAQAAVASAEAEVREAERQLARTTIVAPADGIVGNKNVEIGNRVQAGETLLALVEPDVWVVANYKETQLARMRPGQEVELTIDALPGEGLHGRVESLAPASGAQFALLPPDNATGNFTKVGQRVPVKITLDAATLQRLADRLRPGLSSVVNVRVR